MSCTCGKLVGEHTITELKKCQQNFKQTGLCPECGDNLELLEEYNNVTAHSVFFGNTWKLDDQETEFDGLVSSRYVCNSCQWSDKE